MTPEMILLLNYAIKNTHQGRQWLNLPRWKDENTIRSLGELEEMGLVELGTMKETTFSKKSNKKINRCIWRLTDNPPAKLFVGHYVQLSFETKEPSTFFYSNDGRTRFVATKCRTECYEYMWVKVTGPAQSPNYDLMGKLDNEPVIATNYKHGDSVEFKFNEIQRIDDNNDFSRWLNSGD